MAFSKQNVFFDLWENQKEKIISFHEMFGWAYYSFQTKEEMAKAIERFVTDNYRFQ